MNKRWCQVGRCRESAVSQYNGQLFCQQHTLKLIEKLEALHPGKTFMLANEQQEPRR